MTDVPSRGSPAWIKWLIALAVCALLGLICLEILNRSATARWQRYAAKLRESGLPLTLEEVENARSTVPPEKNGALIIEDLGFALNAVPQTVRSVTVLESGAWPDACADAFSCIPSKTIERARAFLQTQESILAQLGRLSETPTGRFDIRHEGVANPFAILIPGLTKIRNAERLLRLRFIVHLVDGRIDESMHDLQLLEHLAGTLDENGFLIGRMMQAVAERHVARLVEGMMAAEVLDSAILDQLEAAIQRRLVPATLKWTFLTERAAFVRLCESLASGTLSWAQLGSPLGTNPIAARWMPPFQARRNQMHTAEMFTWLIEAADDPTALKAAQARFIRKIKNAQDDLLIVRACLPDFTQTIMLHFSTVALFQTAKAAIASERFRLSHGEFPSQLQDVVPEFLDEVPTDPFSGEPMLMAATEKGIVIYSVGENETDDGGQVTRRKKNSRSPDVGFRLLRPEHRGLLLIDDTEQEEGP